MVINKNIMQNSKSSKCEHIEEYCGVVQFYIKPTIQSSLEAKKKTILKATPEILIFWTRCLLNVQSTNFIDFAFPKKIHETVIKK